MLRATEIYCSVSLCIIVASLTLLYTRTHTSGNRGQRCSPLTATKSPCVCLCDIHTRCIFRGQRRTRWLAFGAAEATLSYTLVAGRYLYAFFYAIPTHLLCRNVNWWLLSFSLLSRSTDGLCRYAWVFSPTPTELWILRYICYYYFA